MNNNQLNQFQIFDDLNDDQISQFHSALKEVTIDKGKKFITEGEQGDSIYLLLSGSVEIDQAALFLIDGFPDDRLDEALNSACPLIMFPYLRETLDNVLLKAGYPPLMLAPINFDAMYKEKKAIKQAEEKAQNEKKH